MQVTPSGAAAAGMPQVCCALGGASAEAHPVSVGIAWRGLVQRRERPPVCTPGPVPAEAGHSSHMLCGVTHFHPPLFPIFHVLRAYGFWASPKLLRGTPSSPKEGRPGGCTRLAHPLTVCTGKRAGSHARVSSSEQQEGVTHVSSCCVPRTKVRWHCSLSPPDTVSPGVTALGTAALPLPTRSRTGLTPL